MSRLKCTRTGRILRAQSQSQPQMAEAWAFIKREGIGLGRKMDR